jgi:hypothetical protein
MLAVTIEELLQEVNLHCRKIPTACAALQSQKLHVVTFGFAVKTILPLHYVRLSTALASLSAAQVVTFGPFTNINVRMIPDFTSKNIQ